MTDVVLDELSATSFMHAKLGLHKKLLCFYNPINLNQFSGIQYDYFHVFKFNFVLKCCCRYHELIILNIPYNHKNIIRVHQFIVLWGNKSDSKVLDHVHQSVVCIHLISKIFNRILRALCLPLQSFSISSLFNMTDIP